MIGRIGPNHVTVSQYRGGELVTQRDGTNLITTAGIDWLASHGAAARRCRAAR